MEKQSKLIQGIVMGALVGAVVSMFDKDTREHTIKSGKRVTAQFTKVIKNPHQAGEAVKEKFEILKNTVEQIKEDVSFVAEKVEELREVTPQVIEIVKDTKNVLMKEKDEHYPQ